MNKATLKSRATLLGKVFAAKGLKLTRAEQLDLVAQLEGAHGWHHACSEPAPASVQDVNTEFDALQLEVAKAYCGGDFAHIKDQVGLSAIDDSVFRFAISETGEAEGNRDEAVRMIRQGADELNALADELATQEGVSEASELVLVPKHCEPAMHYEVTTPKGQKLDWAIRLISDRFGEVNPRVKTYPHLADWVLNYQSDFELMASRCLDEMAFVAELNGLRGVLFEVEIVTTESEGEDADGKPHCAVSEAQRLAQLQRDVVALELEHPELQWAIGGPIGMMDDRLGVWAFCPQDQLFTLEGSKAVLESLYNKFYSS